MKTKKVKVGRITFGADQPLVLIAGPCVIESEKSVLTHARKLKKITEHVGIPFIFKSSYDKANRSSVDSFRGPGLEEGLAILRRVKERVGVPILSDIHSTEEVEPAARVLDIIQIPAFLCRQTDLLLAAGKTGKVVNVKKGQFMAPWDMQNVVEKIASTGNHNILLTERGHTFGYNTLVSDFRSIVYMRRFGYPVVYDATHSVQQPGGRGKSSGGEREYIPALAKAAVVIGVDALFMEVHENPNCALSDGPNSYPLSKLSDLLTVIKKLSRIARS